MGYLPIIKLDQKKTVTEKMLDITIDKHLQKLTKYLKLTLVTCGEKKIW